VSRTTKIPSRRANGCFWGDIMRGNRRKKKVNGILRFKFFTKNKTVILYLLWGAKKHIWRCRKKKEAAYFF